MVTNIVQFLDKFVSIPTKYIENPSTQKEYMHDLYYKISSVFVSFTKNELMDMFDPEQFYYDSKLNLYLSIRLDYDVILGEFDDMKDADWGCTIKEDHYPHPEINYCFNTNKVLLTINHNTIHRRSEVLKPFDYDFNFLKEYMPLDEFYDWRTFRAITTEALEKAIDGLSTHKYFETDPWCDHNMPIEKRKKHDIHSMPYVCILQSFRVVAGIYVEVNYKHFSTTRNKLDYKSGYWKNNYDFSDKIFFSSLIEDPNYFYAFDEDFVKECVAYHAKGDIQNEIEMLSDCIIDQITALENEIKKLYKKIDDNRPKIEKLKEKKKKLKGKNIKLNFKETDK